MTSKPLKVTRFAVDRDDRVSLFGRPYRFEKNFDDGIVIKSDDDKPHEVVALTWQDFDGHLRRFTLKVEKGFYTTENAIERARNRKKQKLFQASPEDVLRSLMVRTFLEEEQESQTEGYDVAMARSDNKIERFFRKFEIENAELVLEARIDKKKKKLKNDVFVGARHFRRLVAKFEDSQNDDNALVRQNKGREPSGSNFTSEQQEYFARFANLFLNHNEPTVMAAFGKMEEDHLARGNNGEPVIELCSYTTFLRIVREIDDVVVDLARGRDKHRVMRKYIMSGKGLRVTYPMQILEMDEHKVDLVRVFKNIKMWKDLHPDIQARIGEMGRPWLSVAMDAFSRSICGMRLLPGDPDSAESVATLAMAVRNKESETALSGFQIEWPQCGTPDAVHTDAGSAYIASDFQRAVIGLTGKHRIPPSKHPHLRGRVERFFKTLNSRYMHMFSGRTFSNVLSKDNYDPAKHAHLDNATLGEILIRLIIGAYHNTPHRNLNGETPLDAWYRGSQHERPVSLPPSDEEYCDIFGIELERKIGNGGLTILGIPYWSEELSDVRDRDYGSKLKVRLNDQNLGSVSFEDPQTKEWQSAHATFEGFNNVSLSDWMETVVYIKKHHGSTARNARRAKEIVLKTLTDVQMISDKSRLAAGVTSPLQSRKTIEQFERKQLASFDYSRHLLIDRGGERPNSDTREVEPTVADPMNPQGQFDRSTLAKSHAEKHAEKAIAKPRKAPVKPKEELNEPDETEVSTSPVVLRIEEMDGSND